MSKKRRQFYQSVTMTVEWDGEESNEAAQAAATPAARPKSAKKLQEVSPIRARSGQGEPEDNGDIQGKRDKDSGAED